MVLFSSNINSSSIFVLSTYLLLVLWHCWLGHFTRKNPSPDMTYNVFGGTLNLTQSIIKVKVIKSEKTWNIIPLPHSVTNTAQSHRNCSDGKSILSQSRYKATRSWASTSSAVQPVWRMQTSHCWSAAGQMGGFQVSHLQANRMHCVRSMACLRLKDNIVCIHSYTYSCF